jgi:hypothetical protein
VGTHTITAVYNGDGNFNGSTSSQLLQVVQSGTLISQPATSAVLSTSVVPSGTRLTSQSNTFVVGISTVAPASQQIAASTRPAAPPAPATLQSNVNRSIVDDFFTSVGRGEEAHLVSAGSRLRNVLNQVLSSLFGL